jgi:hypothetical protein
MLTPSTFTESAVAVANTARCCVGIGEVSIGLTAASSYDIGLSERLETFKIPEQVCDIEINIEWTNRLRPFEGKRIFDSGSLWTLYSDQSGFIFDFVTPLLGNNPYKRLRVNKSFDEALVSLNREYLTSGADLRALEYPLDELLVTNWLALGRGVEVHGCGLLDRETGAHLFLGHSGAGKSTTSMLWTSLRNAHILSDDRIILRVNCGHVWMHGTPWHGEAGYASPEKAELKRIFILEHGECNEIVRMTKSDAVAELFARCFPPFHGHTPIGSTLAFLHGIADSVPCYRFRFLPNLSGVEHILDFDRA